MTVCLFTVHMLFPAALAAMSSLHSKQPECTWAVGCPRGANTPPTLGCSGVTPSHMPPARGPCARDAIRDVGCHWDVGTARGPLLGHSREGSVSMKVLAWGEAAGVVRGRIDRAAAWAAPSSARRAGNVQPAVAKAMALHRHSKLCWPHRSEV